MIIYPKSSLLFGVFKASIHLSDVHIRVFTEFKLFLDIWLCPKLLLFFSILLSKRLTLCNFSWNFAISLPRLLLSLIVVGSFIFWLCLQRIAIAHHQFHRSRRAVWYTICELLAWQHDGNNFLSLLHIKHQIISPSKICLVLHI